MRVVTLACVLSACGSSAAIEPEQAGGAGGTLARVLGGGGGGAGGGGGGGRGGGAGGTGAEPVPDPYENAQLLPDSDLTPVESCTGQPDLSLCSVETSPDRSYDVCIQGACVSPGCGTTDCNPPSPHFRISGTPNPHVRVDGEVLIDLVSGLHWQRCAEGLSGDTCASGEIVSMMWPDALAFCNDLDLGGHDDWYLPDMHESRSLYGTQLVNGGSPGGGARKDEFWTSVVPHANGARSITPVGNQERLRTTALSVRCVRRGFSRHAGDPAARFVANNETEPTTQDTVAGLTWQACYVGATGSSCGVGSRTDFASSEAAAACESLEWAGHSDWRLPSLKELFSLLDYGGDAPGFTFGVFKLDQPGMGRGPYLRMSNLALFDLVSGKLVGPDPSGKYPQVCVRYTD